jgi:hypothetical protein
MSEFGADGRHRPEGEPPQPSWGPPPAGPYAPPPGGPGSPPGRSAGPAPGGGFPAGRSGPPSHQDLPPGSYGQPGSPGSGGPPSGGYGPPPGGYGGPAPRGYGSPGGGYGSPGGGYGPPGGYGPVPGGYGPPPGGSGGPPGGSGGSDTPPQGWAYPPGPPPPGYRDELQDLPLYAPPPRRARGRAAVTVIATATAVVLTAGGVYAYTALSGATARLASRTPGDAVGYLEVNLDPPAAQKVAAIRFLRRFPQAKTGDENGSLLESVVEPLIPDEKSRRLFADDIETWLGKHAAVAADPQAGTLQTVVLAETTDEAKTRAGLERINAEQPAGRSKVRYAIADGVVYLAKTQQAADTAARDGGTAALDGNDTFGSDVDEVGTDGIVTFWSDLAAAARYDKRANGATAQGRVAGSLRFTDTTADLRIRAIGNQASTGSQAVGPRLAKLPDDTAVAVGLSGGDQLVRSAYEQLDKVGLTRVLEKAERDSGLRLPDDVAALVGSSTVVALGGTGDQRGLGLVSTTDDQAAARRAADTLLRKVDPDSALTVRSTADGTVLASSAAYADQLTADGGLGRQQLFTDSLPDLDSATVVVYVDLRKVADISRDALPPQVAPLRSVGLTASSSGDGSDIHLRLVAG